MGKRVLKWFGIIAGSLAGLLLVAFIIIYIASSSKLGTEYAVAAEKVNFTPDSTTLERGRHLTVTRGCVECHPQDLGGGVVIDDGAFGLFYASNITPGGRARDFTDDDWTLAIRHGVSKEGRGLILMPSEEYYYVSDDDLGALVTYLKQIPAVERETKECAPGPIARMLFVLGELSLAAEKVDHTGPRPNAPPPGATVAYGEYMAVGCTGCHGKGFSGGPIIGGDPAWPPAKNLTPDMATGIGKWNRDDFFRALRQHIRPDGTAIDTVMPRAFGKMTDDELDAIWLALREAEPKPFGNH